MAEKARVGIIGLGWWGGVLTKAAGESGELEVVSCFARTPESRDKFAAEHDVAAVASLEEMLEDPELQGVLIATTHSSHRQLIEQAAAAGKHIFVEKPLTARVEDARAVIDAARRGGVQLQVGHQRRRTAANRRIKQMIQEDELGEIQMLESHHSAPLGFTMAEEAWRWDQDESPLGSMTSLGIHKIDTLTYFAGRIQRVFAFTRPGREVTIDEATALSFEFESGAVGILLTSFFTPVLSRVSVHGTDATAYMEADGQRLTYQRRGETNPGDVSLPEVNPLTDELTEFAGVARGEATPEVGGEEGLEAVAVLEAAVVSAETAEAQDVASFRG